MSRPPLRVPLEGLAHEERDLPEEAARYVARVHRRGPGDDLVLFDPSLALEADAAIVSVSKAGCRVKIATPRPSTRRPTRAVTLVQGIGKGDKMDAVVRDATELGATRVVPAIAARSVARPSEARAERLRRVAIEAARQCGRGDAPAVEAPMPLAEALARCIAGPPALSLVLDPQASDDAGARLVEHARGDGALVVVVGPEGGFADEELAEAERLGYARVALGPFVLRTETVCAALLGALLILSGAARRPS